MKPILFISTILSATFAIAGCAGVTHKPVTYHPYPIETDPARSKAALEQNDKEDKKQKGVRYYLSSPYLLVYTDGKGNLIWKIYNILDQTKLMVAEPTQVLAKTTSNLTFSNGVLTTSHTETDSTAIPKAVIAALEKVLPSLVTADMSNDVTMPAPRLYKLIVDQDNLNLVGTQTTDTISISLKAGN